MVCFPLSALLLKYSRGRLRRTVDASIGLAFFITAMTICFLVGNLVQAPITLGIFAAYAAVIFGVLWSFNSKVAILQFAIWMVSFLSVTANSTYRSLPKYDQHAWLHRQEWSKDWGTRMIRYMTRARAQPVCIFVKTDEVGAPLSFHQRVPSADLTLTALSTCPNDPVRAQ